MIALVSFRSGWPNGPDEHPREFHLTYLENLQLLEAILNQLLDLSRVLLALVLAKGGSRPALGVFAEIVCAELATLS